MRLGSVIKKEESLETQKENALAMWEQRKPHLTERAQEMGEYAACNLRGTPADCPRGMSLLDDLRFWTTKTK